LMSALAQFSKEIGALEDSDKTKQPLIDEYNRKFKESHLIEKLSNVLDTTDANALSAVMLNVFPELDVEAYFAAVTEVLKDREPRAAPETVQRSTAQESAQNDRDEEGYYMIDEIAFKEKAKEFMEDVLGEENICGGIK
jgi:hypothetical protein